MYRKEVRGIILKCMLEKEVLKLGRKWRQFSSGCSFTGLLDAVKVLS
jgi:hypothetical protein